MSLSSAWTRSTLPGASPSALPVPLAEPTSKKGKMYLERSLGSLPLSEDPILAIKIIHAGG